MKPVNPAVTTYAWTKWWFGNHCLILLLLPPHQHLYNIATCFVVRNTRPKGRMPTPGNTNCNCTGWPQCEQTHAKCLLYPIRGRTSTGSQVTTKLQLIFSVKRWATGWTIGVLGFDPQRGLGIFLFTTASRTALGPTQPPNQSEPEALSLGVKRPRREADHSLPSSA
jgi:hypothetical protein